MEFKIEKLAFSVLVSAFVATFLAPEFSAAVCALAFLAGIALSVAIKGSYDLKACIFGAAVGTAVVMIALSGSYYPEKALGGVKASITGTVKEISVTSGNPQYTVETESIALEGTPQKVRFKLSGWGEQDISPYDKISCEVSFMKIEEKRLSDMLTERSNKTQLYAYMESMPEVIGKDTGFPEYHLYLVREKLASIISEKFSSWRIPFTKQLLLGTRGEIPSEILSVFRYAGMSHVLAISGLHLSIIMGLAEKLMKKTKFGKNSRKRRIILIAAALLYMFIAGLGKSVLRAGIMFIVAEIAGCIHTDIPSKDRLGIAIISVIFLDPLSACDIGFLLSAVSSASIIHFSIPIGLWFEKKVIRKRGKFAEALGKVFSVTVSAWLSTVPLSLIFFGGVSIVAPVANMISSLFASGAVSFGMISVILGLVPFFDVFSGGSAFLAETFENLLYSVAEFFAGLPFSYLDSLNLWELVWLIGSIGIILFSVVYLKGGNYIKLVVLVSVATLLTGLCCSEFFYAGTVSATLTSLEYGTAITCSKDGDTVLIVKGVSSDDLYKLKDRADILVSVGSTDTAAELSLVEKAKPDMALVSSESTSERFQNAKLFSPGRLTFWNDGNAIFPKDGIFEIDASGILILYISEKCDIMELEPQFRRADIAIFDGVSPEELGGSFRCDTLVLRERGGYYSFAENIEVLEEGELRYCSRGNNLKKGWVAA